ncbi:HK97-gp10 family putative phage morphogenesis protein [Vreelandella sedimenti]|uniref:HK97-gp10 family putative phage morphogenesis protein n=1 Tax=Vreelandella sedimenti TaxID=2729618 RepID=UPI00257C2A86|nr:HK97-gp10 family putative phage morphogenesis protein [Halomonas sp. UBA3173]|tara:strand:- start:146750 stop:147202 length:453 start_codon:yes stop_codon:yes gene_type:complete
MSTNNNNLNNLIGSRDVLKRMNELKETQIISVMRSAGRKAMQSVLDDAKRNASQIDDTESPLSIADNIVMKTSYRRTTGDLTIKVGIQGGARYRRGDKEKGLVTYWRYVEFGTEHSAAHPFLRPAMDSNQSQIFATFLAEVAAGINRRLK